MKGFWRPLFLRFLLLCVMLNLGDAPYVDELIDELNQSLVITALTDASSVTSKSAEKQVTKGKHSIYEELLANVAMPQDRHPLLTFNQPETVKPEAIVVHPPSPPPFLIERPPRSGFTA